MRPRDKRDKLAIAVRHLEAARKIFAHISGDRANVVEALDSALRYADETLAAAEDTLREHTAEKP